MHYFHTHFNVYPNPQGKVDCGYYQATSNVTEGKLGVSQHTHDELGGREDVQHQVHANETGTGPDVRKAEQHTKRHNKVQSVLKVGPLISPIKSLAVAHPKYAVVGEVSDVPEQQQGSVVMVDQDVLVGFEEASHNQ
tara:strand:- start:8332 stop:8742 length:411 start_codon:yes stop_codon:yes gene_type:complete